MERRIPLRRITLQAIAVYPVSFEQVERIRDQLTLSLEAWVAEQDVETVEVSAHAEVSFPSDWVQAFKARFAPGWVKRRCPVQLTVDTQTTTKKVRIRAAIAGLPRQRPGLSYVPMYEIEETKSAAPLEHLNGGAH